MVIQLGNLLLELYLHLGTLLLELYLQLETLLLELYLFAYLTLEILELNHLQLGTIFLEL
jgi:hypothetical protein